MPNGALRGWRKDHVPVQIDEVQRLVRCQQLSGLPNNLNICQLLEVAEGVQHIHQEGLVHGDLHGVGSQH
jgi:serine/threonine protein kinase